MFFNISNRNVECQIRNYNFSPTICNFIIANTVNFPIKYLSLLNFLCYKYVYTSSLKSWLDQKILLNAFVDAEIWQGKFF